MSPERQLRVLGVAAIALLAWTLAPPPAARPEPPTEIPRPAPRPRVAITRPPAELIRDPPTRADGLDRAAPCEHAGPYRVFPMSEYLVRRRETLDAMLRSEGDAAIGARLRDALAAPVPSGHTPPDIDPRAVRFATETSLAQGAWDAGRTEAAIAYASDAIAIAPDDALGYVLVFLAAYEAGDDALAEAALVHAFRRAPDEIELAWNTWRMLHRTSDVMGALAAADAMLDLGDDAERWIAERAQLAATAHVFADGVRRSRGRATVIGTAGLDVAAAEHVLDLATRALADTEAALGNGPRGELVLYVYPDARTAEAVTCRAPEDTILVRADVDGPDTVLVDRLRIVAMRNAMRLVPAWLREAILAREDGVRADEDLDAYARMVASGHWIAPADIWAARRDPQSRDARVARAEARAIVEWIVARRGDDVLRDLTTGSIWMRRDPTRRISEIAGAPLDEPTLLAFLAERLAAQAHAAPDPTPRAAREMR